MTRDDALTIVGMLASHYPGKHWNTETMDAYAKAIEPLDARLTTAAVVRAVNELEFYPKVSVLREYVRIERRQEEYDRALQEAPVEAQRMSGTPAPKYECPDWVKGWALSRHRYRDFRPWPQQDPYGHLTNVMPAEDQNRYLSESKSLSVAQVFSMIGVGREM